MMNYFKNIGIASKLVSILVCFSLIPLSVQVYSLFETAQVLEGEVGAQYQSVAEDLAYALQQAIVEQYADAQTMSRNRILRDRSLWYQTGDEVNEIVEVLNEYVQASGVYYLIEVVDREGQLIAVNDRDSQGQPIRTERLYRKIFHSSDWFQGLQQDEMEAGSEGPLSFARVESRVFVEDVAVDRDVKAIFPTENGLTIGLSIPLYDRGEVMGYWTQRMKYSMVEMVVQHTYQRLKKAGFPSAELTLQNGQGFTILEYVPSVYQHEDVVHDLENVLFRTNLPQLGLEAAQLAVQGRSGFSRNFHPGKQGMQVIGFSHLQEGKGYQGLPWSILVQVPEEEAFMQVKDMMNEMLVEMFVGLLVVILIGLIMGRRMIGWLKPSLSQASNTLSHVGHQKDQVSQSQVNQVTQVAVSVEEEAFTAGDIAQNTQGLSVTAMQVNESGVRGGEVVSSSIQDMEPVSNRMKESASRIQTLGQRPQEIGDIIVAIDDIVEQTNLLALNAAIEAARAGEQGRGFAVVADEIRKFAERTGKATKEMTTVIESVGNGTNGAVHSMEAEAQETHNGMTLAREAGSRLTEIVTGVQRVVDMIQQFAISTQQQSEVSGQLSSRIDLEVQLSQENDEHVQGVTMATRQFAVLAADLQPSLSRFTLKHC